VRSTRSAASGSSGISSCAPCRKNRNVADAKRLKELGLACNGIQRTKADCLQVCAAGPIAVVWPDGVWYHSCDEEGLEQIIQQHLIGGEPVEQLRLRVNDGERGR
jgi:(2Fe-2S) ferredoxin